MKQFLLVFLFCCLGWQQGKATHIVGGEITYKCLGNSLYEVNLTVYRDCYNGEPWFDKPAYIGVYDAQWTLVKTLTIELDSTINDTIPIILNNPCLTAPPDVCVHRTTYKTTVQLPFKPGGYTLVYQRCCRNKLIQNLPDPLNTGISYTATITEATLQQCNSSAVFNNWPPVAICIHQPIDFDHSASDPDGDILRYRICTPLNGPDSLIPQPIPPFAGPYQEIIWKDPPYNLSNLLGGTPLRIDSITGFITGVPNTLGNFVVGICVEEIRNGEVISVTRRDFQYNVADCGQPNAAFFVPTVQCDQPTVNFENLSTGASTYKWLFDLENNPTLGSSGFSANYTYPDTGLYTIMLVVDPGEDCTDTLIRQIRIANTYINASVDVPQKECDDNGIIINVTDQSSDPYYGVNAWQWRLTRSGSPVQGGTSMVQNPEFLIEIPGMYSLLLITTSGNGCKDSLLIPFDIAVPNLSLVPDTLSICKGESISLFPGALSNFDYQWTPATWLNSDTIPNPMATPQESINYSLQISDTTCIWDKNVYVYVATDQNLMVTATPPKIFFGQSSQLDANLSPGFNGNIKWTPTNSLSNANIYNPVATPSLSTVYEATAILTSGCVLRGTALVEILFLNCDERYVFLPTGFSPNGDSENDVLKLESNNVVEVYWVIYNRWGEKVFEADSLDDVWDGTYKGEIQPVETYGFYLRATCDGGQVFTRKGNVTLLR